jgi:hypothetical protein
MADKIDEGNNFDERRTITHARNACFEIAKDLGITYFMQLDDDYTDFRYRLNSDFKYITTTTKVNIDNIIDAFIDFYKSINAKSIAFSQGGDFLGGINSGIFSSKSRRRKCMNSFLCSTKRPFQFIGAMNEDVNTYTTLGSRGSLFLTFPNFAL